MCRVVLRLDNKNFVAAAIDPVDTIVVDAPVFNIEALVPLADEVLVTLLFSEDALLGSGRIGAWRRVSGVWVRGLRLHPGRLSIRSWRQVNINHGSNVDPRGHVHSHIGRPVSVDLRSDIGLRRQRNLSLR